MSSEADVVWPNIGIVRGRLFGLGLSVPLPLETRAVDAAGNLKTIRGGEAHLLQPCVAMTPDDREWLATQDLLGYQAAMVASEIVLLLPAAAELQGHNVVFRPQKAPWREVACRKGEPRSNPCCGR